MEFTLEQIQMIAKLERDMISGLQPYVVNREQKWAFAGDILAQCGCVSGQEVSDLLLIEIMKIALTDLKRRADEQAFSQITEIAL